MTKSKFGFTPIQKTIFDSFSRTGFCKNFYFTGGTALSVFYFDHRESEDLDFFSESDFDVDLAVEFMEKMALKLNAKLRSTSHERVKIFELVDDNNQLVIKVDFGFYPHPRLKKGMVVDTIEVDSLEDIGANKLHTVLQRTQVKDFVDLYFLLKKYTIWDLLHFAQEKFRIEIDLIWLSAGLLKAQSFDYLPKMLVPLELEQLKDFYRDLAKKLGMKAVKK